MILNFNKNQTKHTNFHGEVVFAGTLLVLLSRPTIQRAVILLHLHFAAKPLSIFIEDRNKQGQSMAKLRDLGAAASYLPRAPASYLNYESDTSSSKPAMVRS